MRSTNIPESQCPYCGCSVDSSAHVFGDRKPKSGDISMCLNCGKLTIFTEDMHLRIPTAEESLKINNLPEVIEAQLARIAVITKDLLK